MSCQKKSVECALLMAHLSLSNGYDSKSDSEREAEQFASYLLMPYDGLEWYIEKYGVSQWDVKAIIELSQFYKMSYMSVL